MFRPIAAVVVAVLTFSILAVPVFADNAIEGRAGRAEMRFLQGMIDHHQMALDMAVDCLAKGETEDVAQLCQAVIAAQSVEIEQMQAWLLGWYGITYTPVSMLEMAISEVDSADSAGHGGHGSANTADVVTDPPMTMGMFAGLNRLEGTAYEVAWLEAMIDHHDDALHMSERALGIAEHAPLRDLAETIISAQTAEIEVMESLIAELGG
jgi:uncharacterized protein (DUF305 family)